MVELSMIGFVALLLLAVFVTYITVGILRFIRGLTVKIDPSVLFISVTVAAVLWLAVVYYWPLVIATEGSALCAKP